MLRLLTVVLLAVPFCSASACLPGDFPFESSCFAFDQVHGTFQNANSHCSKVYGGSLIKIFNRIENNWIQKLAVDNLDADYDFFWIGTSDADHIGTWQWVDGNPLNFTNWFPGQPLEDRHCATMQLSTGKWFSDVCSVPHQFVCQYPQNGGYTVQPNTCPPCPSCAHKN